MEDRNASPKAVIDFYNQFIGATLNEEMLDRLPNPNQIEQICRKSIENFQQQGTVIKISGAFTIIGDIHGNLQDLLNIFSIFGFPPRTKYMFLGDYVDRGQHSIEVIILLLSMVCKFPQHVYLIRGNHEFQHINKVYGFFDEIMAKYNNADIWRMFNQVFSYLPLASIINEQIFCVHGGLSPLTQSILDISSISLPIVSYEKLPQVSDLVWSDPTNDFLDFVPSDRGAGVLFGKRAVEQFLQNSNLSLLVRGHQCISTGVHAFAGTLGITIFSSSKYVNDNNKCGVSVVTSHNNLNFYSIDGLKILEKASMSLKEGMIGLQPYSPTKLKSHRSRRTPQTMDGQ